MATPELLALARLCGVTGEFRDNFGKRRRTSRATMEALLTAMGVPCSTPAQIRDSLERGLGLLTDRLLPPVTVATPDTGRRLLLHLKWPRSEIPAGMAMTGEFTGEQGEKRPWQPLSSHLVLQAAQPTADGHILRLSLPLPPDLPLGYYDLKFSVTIAAREKSGDTYLAVSPGQAYIPPDLEQGGRLWGLNLPLYALRSRHNWGIGDFTDLRAVTDWAQELGAAFVGVNPLHAPQPGPHADPSPYAPSSRLFLNYLYVSLENVPDVQDSPAAQALLASPDFQAELARLRHAPLVKYPDVRRLKDKFLHLLFEAFIERHGLPEAPRTSRGRDFARFAAEGGAALKNFSLFQALVEHQGKKDWRRWPQNLKRPDTPAVAAFARKHQREITFYQYVQWLAAAQRQAVWDEAYRAGLPFTLYQDMALGAHPGGFETWGHPGFFATGATIGAPPDAFNLKGQNWGLPPLIPRSLEESGYRLFIDTMRANLPPGGIVRLDHVMGLFRLYWIPAGLDPRQGAYVRYPAHDLLGLLTLESQRRRTLVIGEDLGTVAPGIRRDLAQHRIFSYRVFYFERKSKKDNSFARPKDYPRQAMACVTTHDLPTLAGYWEGRDLELRQKLNLYPSAQLAQQDVASRAEDRRLLVEALVRQGLLPPNYSPPTDTCPEEIRRGVLAYLGQSRAALVETRLEEFLGLSAQQNLPGTITQHPNWRQKISAALEDLRHDPLVIRLAATLRQARKKKLNFNVKELCHAPSHPDL
jgi:4-alpha-glucanotransferase|uniref:4-alpha-glucanotransferase n=1 Tax=Desulfobacca acetoxidans TaxID=60893 RepID=A0A7V6DQK7_9BACT